MRNHPLPFALLLAATLLHSAPATAEPVECLSANPTDWPVPARPYVMLAVDTSASMATIATATDSCGFGTTMNSTMRCSLRNAVTAFSGNVHFGLASFTRVMTSCGAACFGTCTFVSVTGDTGNGCGPEPAANADSSTRAGGLIRVPLRIDTSPPTADNSAELLTWMDNSCTNSRELFASGLGPTNGLLRDMYRYLSNQWTPPSPIPGGNTLSSPLTSAANGERPCRTVNVLLVIDGADTCDTGANAVDAAGDLLVGFTKDGIIWRIKTHVIDVGTAGAEADQIASAGGTNTAYHVSTEAGLTDALSRIIRSTIAAETCDNLDNDCNGCTDEGFRHHCNVGPTCCPWGNTLQRTVCMANWAASITAARPQGDLALLPCTTVAQAQDPAVWLCPNPGEVCDSVDNNCVDGVDEGTLRCGSPLHCPQTEVCDGTDNDCDGPIDEAVCGGCTPRAEWCDGCDNDCDGIVDDGIADVPCQAADPAHCAGTITCRSKGAPVSPGGCVSGGGPSACLVPPVAEVCDGVDNNCNHVVDDGVPQPACTPVGAPPGLSFGPTSSCRQGRAQCNAGGVTTCEGFVGPTAEVCDGQDNDCDGTVDDNVPGENQPCGVNQAPCSPGVTRCINGALVCFGGTPPQPERCDGVDNDCNGTIDDGAFIDAPAVRGCWTDPGLCCSNAGLTWCPPPGADCDGPGMLTGPCQAGVLTCGGGAGWVCTGARPPSSEVCDGLDNDCSGVADDGNLPNVGTPCGSSVGECESGVLSCDNGRFQCTGIAPRQELCDGDDDDCDGATDNGISVTGPCDPSYDRTAYPGDRSKGACRQGVERCLMASLQCEGAVGPSPELCNGVDDDCDGTADEAGSAPDGVNGSVDPTGTAVIGAACGIIGGACTLGAWTCERGQVVCRGGVEARDERCNGVDDDCDGVTDEANAAGGLPLCDVADACAVVDDAARCVRPCTDASTCPTGQTCAVATSSETGQPIGMHCVPGGAVLQRKPSLPPGNLEEEDATSSRCECARPGDASAPVALFALWVFVRRASRRKGGAA